MREQYAPGDRASIGAGPLRSDAGKRLEARIPLRRVGRPDDLDGAMLLLASPAGAYITGAVIAVDGGHGVAAI